MASTINGTSTGNGGLISTGDDSGILNIQTNETTAITVDASQNVGIGTTSPSYKLHVVSSSASTPLLIDGGTNTYFGIKNSSQTAYLGAVGTVMYFENNGSERMRITSGGYLKASNTGTYQSSTSSNHELRTSNGSDFSTYITNSNASTPYGLEIQFTAAAPNNTSQSFCLAEDTANLRFVVMANGGIKNYSANNVNLSDRREKTNFAPAKSYLNTICSIPVQTFNYIDQNLEEDNGLTLGVIAQDVQEVAPELVKETDWGTKEEPKIRLSIYQTDLQYALMKSIQELKAINDTQAETLTQQTEAINALTARVVALEGA
jgi:hypothetical protein